jgi:signal transduction histidine kinase
LVMDSQAKREEQNTVVAAVGLRDAPNGHALDHATASLRSGQDATAVLRQVVQAAQALTSADGVAILLYDRESALFVPAVPSVAVGLDEHWLQRQGLEAAQSLALRAVEAHQIVEALDTTRTPELDYPLLAGGRRPGAVAVAPLEVEDTVVGVLGVYHAQPCTAHLDGNALGTFAQLASLAITIAWAHERERTLLARLQALDEATRALAAELSLDQVLQRIVEVAARVAGAQYGALGIAGPDGYLTAFITTGISPEERAKIGPLPRGHGLLGVLIRQGQPLRVPNIAHDPRRVGFPPHHPPMTSLLGVPIRVRNEVVGDLYLADKVGAPEFSAEDQHLIELLAAHAGIAIENARLYAQVRELTQLRERERIGRDLHDGIIQDIYAGTLQLEDLAEDLPDEALRERLVGVADHFSGVIRDVRTYITGLRARELEGRLLSEGLVALVQEVNERSDLRATATVDGVPYRLPDETANTLLQITREALSNVVKHAAATQAQVRLAYGAKGVTLTVADDGRGFDPEAAWGAEHRGLRNLRMRTAEAGGTLSIQSGLSCGAHRSVAAGSGQDNSAPGSGTTISVFVPRPQIP